MLPVEENVTHGRWRIEGNQYFSTAATDPPETRYTIILITKKDFVLQTKHTSFMRRGLNRAGRHGRLRQELAARIASAGWILPLGAVFGLRYGTAFQLEEFKAR